MAPANNFVSIGQADAEVSHDGIFKRVCWALRGLVGGVTFPTACASPLMKLAGYIEGDIEMSQFLSALLTGVVGTAIVVHAHVTQLSHIAEIQAVHIMCCLSMIVMATLQVLVPEELNLHDLMVQLMLRPCTSLLIMSLNTILEVGGSHSASDQLWVAACAAFNCSLIYKCYRDMATMIPVVFSAMAMQAFVAVLLKSTTAALVTERDVLKKVRKVLEHNLEAQETMWRSVFDATCMLDSLGCVIHLSPQAADLLQVESPDGAVGLSLSQLAATDSEAGRLDEFLKKAFECPSNQACTIQSTFAAGLEAQIDVQLNAVRMIRDLSDLESPSASCILVGMRTAGPARKSTNKQAPEPHAHSAKGGAEAEGHPSDEGRDMFVRFDAGTEGFQVLECSPELWAMQPKLLNWLPRGARKSFEAWAEHEVDVSDEDGHLADGIIDGMELKIHPAPITVVATRARLQTLPPELMDDGRFSFPATLWLRGVRVDRVLRSQAIVAAKPALATVAEDAGESDLDADGASSDMSITPSESASQLGGGLRVRQPTSGDSNASVRLSFGSAGDDM